MTNKTRATALTGLYQPLWDGGYDITLVIYELIAMIYILSISCEIALKRMLKDLADG